MKKEAWFVTFSNKTPCGGDKTTVIANNDQQRLGQANPGIIFYWIYLTLKYNIKVERTDTTNY